MVKSRKEELLRLINIEVGKAKLMKDTTGFNVKNFGSYTASQSDDRYHAEGAAEITNAYFENLAKLLEQVKASSERACEEVAPPCYVELIYSNGENVKLYLVKHNALLPGVLLITPKSPIGLAIKDKKRGEPFSYEVVKGGDKISYSGTIAKIE